jgi:hypothetical protein
MRNLAEVRGTSFAGGKESLNGDLQDGLVPKRDCWPDVGVKDRRITAIFHPKFRSPILHPYDTHGPNPTSWKFF